MRNLSLVLASAAMLIGASTAMAQTDTTTSTAPAAAQTTTTTTQQPTTGATTTTTTTTTTAAVDNKNEVVCKRMDPATGTRLGARQICKTNAEWDSMHDQVRHDVGAYQQGHTNIGAPGH